jgi:hydroxypyruvate reductase/glycerate 2-kinase
MLQYYNIVMRSHIIKNFKELAVTPLHKDALKILEVGYEAISTEKVILSKIKVEKGHLLINDKDFNLKSYERVVFVGIGKCAADSAVVFEKLLGEYLSKGIVIDVRGVALKKIISRIGTHPLPSQENIDAAESVKEMLEDMTDKDLVITVISGGGSALLCLPHDIKCEMLTKITKTLMEKGASIDEINTARKHLSEIQGGQFAKIAFPAAVVSFIFSDVPGDDISIIASGPTVLDTTTKKDAQRILNKYKVLEACKLPNCKLLETPKEEKYFKKVDNILLLTNKTALSAMKEKAQILGYRAVIADSKVEGEAYVVGKLIAAQVKSGSCLLYGGETTVTLKNGGKGGRNQELVLGALPYVKENSVVVAAASDGWDNTDVAGAIGNIALLYKARELGLSREMFLETNESYEFFKKVGGHINTGRKGSNVSDLYFTLSR